MNSLLKECDILSFHCKPNKDNSPIIDFDKLKLMKKNVLIINTARGNLIDEIDLKNALEKGLIRGAAIDVFSEEPAKNNQLFGIKNIILTPHIAASTVESQTIVAETIANQFVDFFIKKEIRNSV